MEKKKAIIILSGGLDSTTLLYDILNQGYLVKAISFDYGQKHKKELLGAIKTCKKLNVEHKILNLDVLNQIAPSALTRSDWEIPEGHYEDENMKQTVVPFRNQVFLTLACAYAEGTKTPTIFYGAHSGDHFIYWDCRPEFIDEFRKLISLNDLHKVDLLAPYENITKGDIVKTGIKLGVNYSLTTTCYKGLEKACGVCGSCTERLEAFKVNGIDDPIEYQK